MFFRVSNMCGVCASVCLYDYFFLCLSHCTTPTFLECAKKILFSSAGKIRNAFLVKVISFNAYKLLSETPKTFSDRNYFFANEIFLEVTVVRTENRTSHHFSFNNCESSTLKRIRGNLQTILMF